MLSIEAQRGSRAWVKRRKGVISGSCLAYNSLFCRDLRLAWTPFCGLTLAHLFREAAPVTSLTEMVCLLRGGPELLPPSLFSTPTEPFAEREGREAECVWAGRRQSR